MSYGKFRNGHTEYRTSNPNPVHVIDNYLFNDTILSHVTQTGIGFTFYDHRGAEITYVTPGGECEDVYNKYYHRLFYIRDNESGRYWNVNWEPVLAKPGAFSCVHGLGYSRISCRKNGIAAKLSLFVPPGKDAVEIWQLRIENTGDKPRNISVFTYSQVLLKNIPTYGEEIYKRGDFNPSVNGIVASKQCEFLPHDHHTAFLVTNHEVVGYDCSHDAFTGASGMLNRPRVVAQGACTNSLASALKPVTVLQLTMKLEPRAAHTADFLFGIARDTAAIRRYRAKYFKRGGIARAFSALEQQNRSLMACHTVRSGDAMLDMLANIWYKRLIDMGATWCRWGFRGYRDIVQHTMADSLLHPARAKHTLLRALHYQYKNGSALRGWCPVDTKPYADSALWLVFAVAKYIQESGDAAMLDERVAFYDRTAASVYNHLVAAVDFSWKNRGRHGLCLIKFGDWNDSLTRVGTAGKGESTWLTMALARATLEMETVARMRNDRARAGVFAKRHAALAETIKCAAWEGDRFVRCFDDTGRPIGSKKNTQAKIFLNSQSWAMLGHVADRKRFERAVASCDKYLLTDLGYALLWPTYTRFDPHVGRISSMQPGIAENGSIYSHGNVFMMLAFLEAGMADRAYDVFRRINPAYETLAQEKTGGVPYAIQNGYWGPDHRSHPYRTEYSWVTGSVAWFYLGVLEWMFGLRSEYGGLRIAPCIPTTWRNCSAVRHFRGKTFNVGYRRRKGRTAEGLRVVLNGRRIEGNLIDPKMCRKANTVTVYLPASP